MINNIIYKIYPRETILKFKSKVKTLGVNSGVDAIKFMSERLISSIILFGLVLVFFKHGAILAPIITVLYYFLIEHILIDHQIKMRKKRLEKEALFFFEVLVLTLESGRNLKRALDLTVQNIDSEIAEEFKKTLAEVNLGKSLSESLESMKKRIPSDTINNTILDMIQSNTFGNSITDSMYNQIDYLREKQMLNVRAEIQKLPTKISIISVVFFVPIMMLIILSPVLIKYITK